jgi:late competence protein required for DNA uptake (superfamily II DNA/RNA helicase)
MKKPLAPPDPQAVKSIRKERTESMDALRDMERSVVATYSILA